MFRYVGGTCTPIHLSGGCSDYHGDGWSVGSSPEDRSITNTYTYESFVNPHAKCPVCGAPVFFYQSQYGGRVFFDELGPPWPKHPCTDNPAVPEQVTPTITPLPISEVDNAKRYRWEDSGWSPFIIIEIKELDTAPIIKFVGTYKNEVLILYVPDGDLLPENSPVHIRPKGDDRYELATIFATHSGNHDIRAKTYIAYGSLLEAAKSKADKSNSRGAKRNIAGKTENAPKASPSSSAKKKNSNGNCFW